MSLASALGEPLQQAPELTRRPPPQPYGGGVLWLVLLVGILVVWLIVAARRRAGRLDRPDGLQRLPGGGALGNALMDLGSLLQPDRPDAAVIQKLEEEGEHDERGDGRDPERKSSPPSPRQPRQSPHD